MPLIQPPVVLNDKIREIIPTAKVLVVGAGGIGCEILKNLALSGFADIEIIDLDTIDVSNLNRQFLFRKEHVGKSKAVVARESILAYNPDINIKAYHDSITSQDYGVNFFKRFKVVLNALDNRAARNHVNRMCLAADIPLVESGTAGYSGQVELIKKGLTQCYECQPKPPQKTYPGCTIRNTPSEPIHCIVWAKHLFNQLFGEADIDEAVSPDTADPEAGGDVTILALHTAIETVCLRRKSTKQWALKNDYDPKRLFNKFFKHDINYLLTMKNLWKYRFPPQPLCWADAVSYTADLKNTEPEPVNPPLSDMEIWSVKKCTEIFSYAVETLKLELEEKKDFLVWDKDDDAALDFVTVCANMRAHIFNIPKKSRFDVKSIAGNIIPAIATTNAMIAGLVVLITFRVLEEDYENCQSIYLRQKSVHTKMILVPERQLQKANPNCYVCASQPFVTVSLNTEVMTVKEFEVEVLKKRLHMVAPDVILDGKGVFVISSEEGETEANNDKKLANIGIVDGSILKVDDFLQNYSLTVTINHYVAKERDDPLFKVDANPADLQPTAENGKKDVDDTDDEVELVEEVIGDVDDPQEGTSKRRKRNPSEDDDLLVLV